MKMSLIFFYILLTSCFFVAEITAQVNKTTLAKIGNEFISAAEYKNRFELMPHLNPGEPDIDSVKLNFLYTLISEKLWAIEARSIGLGNMDIVKYSLNSLKKILVRDALFKLEVINKFEISDEDLNEGINKSLTALNMNVISSTDSSVVFKLYKSFSSSAAFDSAFAKNDSAYQSNNVQINFGSLKDEYIESELYKMDSNNVSVPFHYQDGWFIFKLIGRTPITLDEQQLKELRKNVKQTIKERRSMNVGNTYLQHLLAGVRVNADEKIGKSLAEKIIQRITINAKLIEGSDSSKIFLSESDIYQMMDEFGEDTLAMNFILFDENPVSLKEFFYDLIQTTFSVRSTERNRILSALSSTIKYLIRQELITREGYRLGLQNLPEITADLKIWEDNFLSQVFKNRFLDSTEVNDEEVFQYFQKRNGEASNLQVNIIEILCKDLGKVESILNEMQNGVSFEQLAIKYSERESTKNKNGEFGWFSVDSFGDIGKNAATMEVGEIFGPILTPDGYSLFKLIGKKKIEKPSVETFEKLKSQLTIDAKANKLSNTFDSFTSRLAKKYGVTIYSSALKNLSTTEINMFTYRYIGFGGVLTAFPFTSPWYNWAKKNKSEIEILP